VAADKAAWVKLGTAAGPRVTMVSSSDELEQRRVLDVARLATVTAATSCSSPVLYAAGASLPASGAVLLPALVCCLSWRISHPQPEAN
jgi:hypothetical protein